VRAFGKSAPQTPKEAKEAAMLYLVFWVVINLIVLAGSSYECFTKAREIISTYNIGRDDFGS
jgi:hypothetical protein